MLRYICVLLCCVSFGLLLANGAPADGTADISLEEFADTDSENDREKRQVVPDYYNNYGGNGGGKRKCNGKRGGGGDSSDVDYTEGSLAGQRRGNNRGGSGNNQNRNNNRAGSNDRTITRLDNGRIRVGANNNRRAGVAAAKILHDPALDTAKADGTLALPDGTLKDGTLDLAPDGTLKDGTLTV